MKKRKKISILNYIIYFIFIALILLLGLQVFTRYIINRSVTWSEEVARWFFVWLIYLGCVIGAKEDKHIRITVQLKLFPPKFQRVILATGDILWIIFSGTVAVIGFLFCLSMLEFPYKSVTTGINLVYIYFIIPLANGFMSFFVLRTLLKRYKELEKLEIKDSRLDV